jgi:WD repeat-containing protein 35
MYIFRETEPEEPVSCSGFICSFSDLQVKVVLLDDIMKRPENPDLADIIDFDTKSLRDTRELLEGVSLQDATQFIENNPHPKLWKLLAESALNKLDFKVAEHAYVKCKDFYGLEFVKKLQNLTNQNLKKAEIFAYFNQFDEAEAVYLEIDRKDLAYQLRRKLGDWFKVIQLLRNGSTSPTDETEMALSSAFSTGSDTQLEEAYNELGDYYSERQKWNLAIQYYTQGRNYAKLSDCYYAIEDYQNLTKILDQLTDNNSLLPVNLKFIFYFFNLLIQIFYIRN